MPVFRNLAKVLPFFILKRLSTRRRNPVKIHFLKGWDEDDNANIDIVDVDMEEWFYGQPVLFTERFDLQEKKEEYERKLKCINEKIGVN